MTENDLIDHYKRLIVEESLLFAKGVEDDFETGVVIDKASDLALAVEAFNAGASKGLLLLQFLEHGKRDQSGVDNDDSSNDRYCRGGTCLAPTPRG